MPGFNVAQAQGAVKMTSLCKHVFPRGLRGLRGTGCSGGVYGRYGTSFRSLFGEPLPGLVTTPLVAPFTRAVATWAGVAEVWLAR